MDLNLKTFNQESNKYLQYRPKYPIELYKYINSLCKNHNIVWDSACGNGQVAIDISKYFNLVEASDIHENQILNAYKKENIHYSVQKSESTSYPDKYFDAICVAQALHWFILDKFFNEVNRILKNNGVFFCWGYSFFKINKEIDEVINNHLLKNIKSYWSEKNKLLHDEYKSINFPFKKIEIPKIDMIEKWNLHQLLEYLKTWSAVKLYNQSNNTDVIDNLEKKLSTIWEKEKIKEIRMDFFIYGNIKV